MNTTYYIDATITHQWLPLTPCECIKSFHCPSRRIASCSPVHVPCTMHHASCQKRNRYIIICYYYYCRRIINHTAIFIYISCTIMHREKGPESINNNGHPELPVDAGTASSRTIVRSPGHSCGWSRLQAGWKAQHIFIIYPGTRFLCTITPLTYIDYPPYRESCRS